MYMLGSLTEVRVFIHKFPD